MTASTIAPLPVGSVAPDFTLDTTSGSTVTLSELLARGPVLLAFFPLAFTSTCTEEVCTFSDDHGRFEEAGVQVLPLSVDSVPTLREFKSKHGVRVDMASDFRRDASRAWGVLVEERFHSMRAYFLVDRDGVVRWSHVEANPGQFRSTDELLGRIADVLAPG